jgi:outer membrane murein-binding lipoprotein Lpp
MNDETVKKDNMADTDTESNRYTNTRFDRINARIGTTNARIDGLTRRINVLDQRLDQLEEKINQLNSDTAASTEPNTAPCQHRYYRPDRIPGGGWDVRCIACGQVGQIGWREPGANIWKAGIAEYACVHEFTGYGTTGYPTCRKCGIYQNPPPPTTTSSTNPPTDG